MVSLLARLWKETEGQGIAEYAMMLAVVLAIVAATIKMIGSVDISAEMAELTH